MPLIETVTDPDMRTPWEVRDVGPGPALAGADQRPRAHRPGRRAPGRERVGHRRHAHRDQGRAQPARTSPAGAQRGPAPDAPCWRSARTGAPRRHRRHAARALRRRDGHRPRHRVAASSRKAVDKGATVLAVPLPGFEGLLACHTQPRTTFLKEFSDRVRVIACIDDLPNLACSTQDAPTLQRRRMGPHHARPARWPPDHTDPGGLGTAAATPRRPARESRAAGTRRRARASRTRRARLSTTAPTASSASCRAPTACTPTPTCRRSASRTRGWRRRAPGLPRRPWERQADLVALGVGDDLAERLSRHPSFALFMDLVGRLAGRRRA